MPIRGVRNSGESAPSLRRRRDHWFFRCVYRTSVMGVRLVWVWGPMANLIWHNRRLSEFSHTVLDFH